MEPVSICICVGFAVIALVGIGVAIKKIIDCNSLQREIRDLRITTDERQSNLSELKERIRTLGSDLENIRRRNQVSEEQVVRYQQQIQALTTTIADRNTKITDLTTQISDLELQIAEHELDSSPKMPRLSNNRYILSGIRSSSGSSPTLNVVSTQNTNRR